MVAAAPGIDTNMDILYPIRIMKICSKCKRDPSCPACHGLGFVETIAQEFVGDLPFSKDVVITRLDIIEAQKIIDQKQKPELKPEQLNLFVRRNS